MKLTDPSRAKIDTIPANARFYVIVPGAPDSDGYIERDDLKAALGVPAEFVNFSAHLASNTISSVPSGRLVLIVNPAGETVEETYKAIDIGDLAIEIGGTVTLEEFGELTEGAITPSKTVSTLTNNGTITINAPENIGEYFLEISNGASAVAPVVDDFTLEGDPYDATENKIVQGRIIKTPLSAALRWLVMQETITTGFTTQLRALQAIPAGFPILVHKAQFDNGTHNMAIFDNMQANGGDLRASLDLAGENPIPIEIYRVITTDGSEELLAFVRNPNAMAIGDKITLHTNGPGGSIVKPGHGDAFGRNNVWQDYFFVTHGIDEDATGASGAFAHTGGATLSGGILNGLPGRGYGATDGSDGGDVTTTAQTGLLPDQVTFSVLMNANGTGGGGFGRVIWKQDGFGFLWNGGGGGQMWEVHYNTTDGQWAGGTPNATVEHWAVRHDSSSVANDPNYRRDGANQTIAEYIAPAGTKLATANPILIGNRHDFGRVHDGKIGMVRLRDGIVDDAWVSLENQFYRNPQLVMEAEALAGV